jgi:hypothetical protein
LCEKLGIRLITVFSDENIKIVVSTIRHIIDKSVKKIAARKCNVIIGSSKDQRFKKFFEENHLQGNSSGCWAAGLEYEGCLVACMSFSISNSERGTSDRGRWELRRFGSSCRVIGGASKLLRCFIRTHPDCESVVSYSDNRWFTGNMYEKIGFSLVGFTRPDYRYVKGKRSQHKAMFKRSELERRPDIDFRAEETEHQNCYRNGWYRVWDCGKKKWELQVK